MRHRGLSKEIGRIIRLPIKQITKYLLCLGVLELTLLVRGQTVDVRI